MAATLLYSFNGLVFSQEIITLSKGISMLPLIIVLASVVVVYIFGWLVAYATRFMLLRRGRELGTYLLIGLENRQVARLFFLENLAVGGCCRRRRVHQRQNSGKIRTGTQSHTLPR